MKTRKSLGVVQGGRFVERLIRTLKLRIFERKKALGGIWTAYVEHVIDQYNDTMHTSIHAKPNHVSSNEYNIPVIRRAHAWMQRSAKYPVTHEALSVGDTVKILMKAPSFYKETFNSWSPKVYTIVSIDATAPEGTTYQLEGYHRALLRYELKKIVDVHRVAQGDLQSALHWVRHPAIAAIAAVPAIAVPQPVPAPHVPAFAAIAAAAPALAAAALPASRVRRPVVIAPRPFTRSVARAQREAANA